MTTLAEVALRLARECLEWEDAEKHWRDDWSPNPGDDYIFREKPEPKSLSYTDLNAVMDAVRQWRDQTQEAFDEYVTVTLSLASGQYIGHAFVGTGRPTTSTAADPCHALLAACVEAQRKLATADQ